jgi:CO/xanthine dehydrogenase FAD-binding subunit
MRIRPFEYYAAKDLKDALEKIEENGSQAKLVAGGTDLVLAMKKKKILPEKIVSLHKLKELEYVRKSDSQIRIGALTKHTDLAVNPILKQYFPILCDAVSLIGSWQIRNVATIGGNLCTASPAADSAGPLLTLDARVVIAETGGEKELALASFFKGPAETGLEPHQLLKEIILDIPAVRSAGCYLKLMRKKAVDLSLASVAFQAEMDDEGKRLSKVAIGLGGVAPTPIRAAEAESVLIGLSRKEAIETIPEVAKRAVAATRPISDVRASASYRRIIVEVYVRQAGEKILRKLFDEEGRQR